MFEGHRVEPAAAGMQHPLREAVRAARIEAAERSAVVVDLRDAELARLELLNDALDPVFAEVPAGVDMFDRGISRGDVPRLWIDMIARVEMGRDKRQYRFLQDTRYGRTVLAESHDVDQLVQAVTQYIARRLVEREHALAGDAASRVGTWRVVRWHNWHQGWRGVLLFAFGALAGILALFLLAMLTSHQ